MLTVIAVAALVRAATLDAPVAVVHRPIAKPAGTRRPAVRAEAVGIAVPGPADLIPPGRPQVSVPILMYHYIRVNPDPRDTVGFGLSVTPPDFAQQMDWLAASGYHPVDLDDLRGYLLGHGSLPARPVVLTFDDGYEDLYTTAYPVLLAHHFKAVSYVVSGFLGSPRYLTQPQLLEMDAHGIQIGAHTVSHVDLTRLSADELRHQVLDSKTTLEALLGHPVLDFCYPFGAYAAAVVDMVQAAGFETATTTQPGVVHTTADRFTWSRVRVGGGESLQQWIAGLGPTEPSQIATVATPDVPAVGRLARLPVTFPLRPPPAAPPAAPPSEGATP